MQPQIAALLMFLNLIEATYFYEAQREKDIAERRTGIDSCRDLLCKKKG